MGIEVVLEDERGIKAASLEDPTNILHRVLPRFDDTSFQHLNRIDWYGDTTFNRNQAPEVRRELRQLANSVIGVEELDMIRQIDAMAEATETGPHLYLKFYGD